MQYNFTIAVCRPLRTVSTLMQAYRTTRSCEGCGDLCMWRLVLGVCDISWIARIFLEILIWLHDCRSIVTSIILLGSGFGDHLSVRVIGETLKQNQPTSGHQNNSPPCPDVEKIFDSHVYREPHCAQWKNWVHWVRWGGVLNNKPSVPFGVWPNVRVLRLF